jgi:outer membrane lipoprotein carrier protein
VARRASKPSMPLLRASLLLATWLLALPAVGDGDGSPGPESAAERACVEAAVERVQRRYEGIRDLSARFEQTSHSVALGSARPGAVTTSRGRVVFAKPGRMRWSYEEPEPSLVVSDGRVLSIYDPGRRELQRLAVGEGFLSGTAIQFLLGEGDLLREFEVAPVTCEEGATELELVPREPATYEKLRLRVDAETGDVLRTAVVDLLGNRTEVVFREIRVDTAPGSELFTFEPPEGVRVIELGLPEPPER